ncbi:MAG: hypothetical protein WCJ29_05990 [bacterium]
MSLRGIFCTGKLSLLRQKIGSKDQQLKNQIREKRGVKRIIDAREEKAIDEVIDNGDLSSYAAPIVVDQIALFCDEKMISETDFRINGIDEIIGNLKDASADQSIITLLEYLLNGRNPVTGKVWNSADYAFSYLTIDEAKKILEYFSHIPEVVRDEIWDELWVDMIEGELLKVCAQAVEHECEVFFFFS